MRTLMKAMVAGGVVVVVLAGVYGLSGIASASSPKVATSGSRSGNQVESKASPTASTSTPPCDPRVLTVRGTESPGLNGCDPSSGICFLVKGSPQ